MKKKILSFLLVGTMMSALIVGCGSNDVNSNTIDEGTSITDNEETTENDVSVEEPADVSDTEDEEETADIELTGGIFKIGGIGPLSGPASVYGIAVMNGSQIAVDEINASGGINDMEIELNFQDDEFNVEKAVDAYNTLKDWGAQAIDGATTIGCSIAVSEQTYQDKVFQLTPTGSIEECTKYDNVFRMCFSDFNQGAASAQYIGENKLASNVAVIYDSSDVFSSGVYERFKQEATNQPFEIVAVGEFTEDTNTDFSIQLQEIKEADAELIFLPVYYYDAATIITQASDIGLDVQFFGCDAIDGIFSVEDFDISLADGFMILFPFVADATDSLTVDFVTEYKDRFDETPIFHAAYGYDTIYAIKNAAEKAGITEDMSNEEICNALSEAMTQITMDGLTGENITWDVLGEPIKAPKVIQIKNGAYTSM